MTDARIQVRSLLREAESDRLLIVIAPRNDPQPAYSGRSAKRAWEDCALFADHGVEIIVKDPKDSHECGRITYQERVFVGPQLTHPSGDWMINTWCGRQHLKF